MKTDEEILKQYEFKAQRRTEKLNSTGHGHHGHGNHGHQTHKHNYDSTIPSHSTLVSFRRSKVKGSEFMYKVQILASRE